MRLRIKQFSNVLENPASVLFALNSSHHNKLGKMTKYKFKKHYLFCPRGAIASLYQTYSLVADLISFVVIILEGSFYRLFVHDMVSTQRYLGQKERMKNSLLFPVHCWFNLVRCVLWRNRGIISKVCWFCSQLAFMYSEAKIKLVLHV